MSFKILESNLGVSGRGLKMMIGSQLVKSVANLTTLFTGYVTDPIRVKAFNSGTFIFQFAFANATSIQVRIEVSYDDGVTWCQLDDPGSPTAGLYTHTNRTDAWAQTVEAAGSYTAITGGTKTGANMNSTADQTITMDDIDLTESPEYAIYQITRIRASNPSVSLDTAVGGVYPKASKGGTAIVANTQVYSALVLPADVLDLTLAAAARAVRGDIFLSLTTGQGATATADFEVSVIAGPGHILPVNFKGAMLARARIAQVGGTDDLPGAQVFFQGGEV